MTAIRTLPRGKFPRGLLEIPDPPEKLFIRGTLPPEDATCLAVVGSRRFTRYGEEACRKIISEIARSPGGKDIVIVSGLAIGIDSLAHKAALEAGLQTVAIPGSGLDTSVLHPHSNRALAEKIVRAGGAVISEMEPLEPAAVYSFPKRNRLMAGISRGVLVVEAAEKSGTLITARLALEYNRDVFAVPGSIFSANTKGVHWLLWQGAIPASSGEMILAHWNIAPDAAGEGRLAKLKEDASMRERLVLDLLAEPAPKDELIRRSGLPACEVNILLSAMEIKGLITESAGEVRVSV